MDPLIKRQPPCDVSDSFPAANRFALGSDVNRLNIGQLSSPYQVSACLHVVAGLITVGRVTSRVTSRSRAVRRGHRTMKLTAQAVARLRHEGALPFRDVKDDGTPGLYLRILKSGGRRWVHALQAGWQDARRPPSATPARSRSQRLAPRHARGAPSSARDAIRLPKSGASRGEERRLPTVAAFAREYIERHAKPNKRSWREDERLLAP